MIKQVPLFFLIACLLACSEGADVKRYKTLSISYPKEVKSGEWIRLDDILFIHSDKVDMLHPMITDSSVRGERIQVCIVPASYRTETLPNGKQVQEKIIGTGILAYFARTISDLNATNPVYKMNVGAKMWLTGEFEILREDGRTMEVTTSTGYNGVVRGDH